MDLPKDQYTNQGSASLLTYKPKDQMDYGTVLCLAENLVGRQVVPCVYHVIPAGRENNLTTLRTIIRNDKLSD